MDERFFLPPTAYDFSQVLHSGFHSRRAETYTPVQSLEGKIALVDMLNKPHEWERNFRR